MISSPGNELIKRARSLLTRKGRERTGLFLVEGPRAIATVMEAGAAVEAVLLADGYLDPQLAGLPVRVETVTPELLASVTDQVTPVGCVALVASPERRERGLLPARVLVADEVRDPGNLGTLLRTADAVGAAVLLAGGCADPLSPKVVRASAGAVVRTAWWRLSGRAARSWLEADGRAGLVLDAAAEESLYELALPAEVALVASNEAHGAGPEWAGYGRRCRLPMRAGTDSLNVGVAAAIALYECVRQYGLLTGAEGAQ